MTDPNLSEDRLNERNWVLCPCQTHCGDTNEGRGGLCKGLPEPNLSEHIERVRSAQPSADLLARLEVYADTQRVIDGLRIAVDALGLVADTGQTSLAHVRAVAERGILDVERALEGEYENAEDQTTP